MDEKPRIDASHAQGVQVGDGNIQHVHFHRTPVTWPHLVGVVPPLAGSRVARGADRDLAAAISGGGTAIVCQILSGLGGVGKTQLAANLADGTWKRRETDLLVWCTASSREQIVSTYTRAAADILGTEDHERFLSWLSTTDKRWLIVLDDLAAPGDLQGLWPPTIANGRTVVTTRRRDAVLRGHGRELVTVGLYGPDEALGYLRGRLGDDAGRLAEADELATDLGFLPLALGQATAYMLDRDLDCAAYRERFAERRTHLSELMPDDTRPDDYNATVATTWSLSIEAADALRPRGAARPVLERASLLDPNGIPLDVLATDADTTDAIHNLRRLNLIDVDGDVVLIHGLVQRTVRDQLDPTVLEAIAHQIADRLAETWPDPENNPALSQPLRVNTSALYVSTTTTLIVPSVHIVLFLAGNSLGNAGQVTTARDYFNDLLTTTQTLLGPDHPDTLITRSNLAYWCGRAGDVAGAARASEDLLADQLRVLGPDHPDTLTTRSNLANWRGRASDVAGAMGTARAFEDLLTDRLRILGPDHPDTLINRGKLADWRGRAGDTVGAVQAFEDLLTDRLRILGPDHPDTLINRGKLANWRGQAGDAAGAALAFEDLLTDQLRVLGPDHPSTLITRSNLADWRGQAGDAAGAARASEDLLTDQLRILGPEHPDTLITHNNLSHWRDRAPEI